MQVQKKSKANPVLIVGLAFAVLVIVLIILILIFTGPLPRLNPPCEAKKIGGEVLLADFCGPLGVLDPACMIAGNFKNVQSGQVCCRIDRNCRQMPKN